MQIVGKNFLFQTKSLKLIFLLEYIDIQNPTIKKVAQFSPIHRSVFNGGVTFSVIEATLTL